MDTPQIGDIYEYKDHGVNKRLYFLVQGSKVEHGLKRWLLKALNTDSHNDWGYLDSPDLWRKIA